MAPYSTLPPRASRCLSTLGRGTEWRPPAYSLFIFKCFTCNFLMDVFHYNLNLLNIIRDCHSFFLHFLYINLNDLSCVTTNLFIKQTQLFSSHTVWDDDLLTDNCDISVDSSLVLLESRSSVMYTQHTHILLATNISCVCDWGNKLCACQHNMPPPPASLTIISCKYENRQRVQLPVNSLKDKQQQHKKISTVSFYGVCDQVKKW